MLQTHINHQGDTLYCLWNTKYKQKLRKIANKKVSLKQKHKIVQTGGFVPVLLAPLLKPVIVPLAGKLLHSAIKGMLNKVGK